VYYVGLLAGKNDLDLLLRTGVGRDINRHYYSAGEIEAACARPVVRTLFDLLRFRNTHPAFAGEFHLLPSADHEVRIEWRHRDHSARLSVDLKSAIAEILYSSTDGEHLVSVTAGTAREVRS
jgi:sucrose phosphorylase